MPNGPDGPGSERGEEDRITPRSTIIHKNNYPDASGGTAPRELAQVLAPSRPRPRRPRGFQPSHHRLEPFPIQARYRRIHLPALQAQIAPYWARPRTG